MVKKIILISSFLSYLVFTPFAFAAVDQINFGAAQPAGVKYSDPGNNPGDIISRAVTILMVVGAIGVLVMMLWGATEWIFSGGDKEKLAAARKKITTALVGLALVALTFFILNVFGKIVALNPLQNFKVPGLGTDQDVSGGGSSSNSSGPGFDTGNPSEQQNNPSLFNTGTIP